MEILFSSTEQDLELHEGEMPSPCIGSARWHSLLGKLHMKHTCFPIFLLFACTLCFGETEEYILQPGDIISINVVEHPEFSGRNKIRPDGRINYPVIGEIDVASLTCAQLVKIMQGKLSSYVNNPVVSVSIEEYYANKNLCHGRSTFTRAISDLRAYGRSQSCCHGRRTHQSESRNSSGSFAPTDHSCG